MAVRNFNEAEKQKLIQIISQGSQVLGEVDDLRSGLRDTVKSIAEELELKPALINKAISIAKEEGLDLIEIAPKANPPVCKIIDMGKYKYDLQKKANKAKKKQKIINLKEIKLRPVTEIHDYNFKIKNAQKFLSKGDKVKFTIRFKGRELMHSNLGHDLMNRIQEDTKQVGKLELSPKFDGKQMIMVIQPL